MTIVRLIAYTPNGASLGPLPTPDSIQAGFVLNDVGALTLGYHPDGARSSLLGQPLEIATEVSSDKGMTWAEPENGRFLYLRDGRDPIQTGNSWAIEAPSYAWRLQKALVGTAGLDDEGKRAYVTATPGGILLDLINRAQSRGALAGMTATWSATNDSNGTPWPETQSIAYDPGMHLLAVLQGMVESGWVDFTTQGRALSLYVAEGSGMDRTVGASPVSLRFGRDLTEAPFRRTWEGLADTAVVMGDNGKAVTRINPAAVKPWGVQETYVSASGVEDDGTLSVLGDAALTYTETARSEHTFGLAFGAATHLPFRDYDPGDWVFAATTGTVAPAKMRLRQITLTQDDDGKVGGNVVLNDRFLEADVLQARRIAKITAGATQSGSGGTPSGIGPDILAPKQPTGLGASSAAYVDPDGFVRSQITLNWNDVTTNADNTPTTDVAGYEVWARIPTLFDWRLEASTTISQWTNSPYEPGQTWEFMVRAVDTSYNFGAFSASASTTTAADLTPPPPPSTPTATSRLGTARITWDGLTSSGTNMAGTVPDWRYITVHVSTVNGFTPDDGNRVGDLSGPGYVVAGPLDYQATYYARLVAWDSSGNASAASTQVPIVVAPLVDVTNFPDTAMEELFARTGHFLDLTADNFSANLIQGAWIQAGAISADKLTVGARASSILRNSYMEVADPDGKPSHWSAIWGGGHTVAGETAAPLSGTRSLRIDFSGTGGDATIGDIGSEFSAVAGQKFYARVTVKAIQASTRDVYLTGRSVAAGANASNTFSIFDANVAIQDLTGPAKALSWAAGEVKVLEGYWTIPANHVRGNVGLEINQTGTAGDAFVIDNLEVWPAASDAQITEVSAGKIVTGIIQATQRIVAGTLTGARAELNGVGFQAFNPGGAKMFEVQANSGETIVGDSASVHIRMGAFNNVWNSGQSQALIRFGYTGSGWADGQIHSQYFPEGGTNWAALRLTSPYEASGGFPTAPFLDLRQNNLGVSKFFLKAQEANFTANTMILGDGTTTTDFRSFGTGFQFSDFSQTSRLRLLPQTGYFTMRSANSAGNVQQLRLQGSSLAFEANGQDINYETTANIPGFASFGRNLRISYGSNEMLIVTYNNDAYKPIFASAFTVNSDRSRKSNIEPVTGALAAVRALPVYDYDMPGLSAREHQPPPLERGLGPLPEMKAERGRGLMADEVAAVLPDAVTTDMNGSSLVSLYDLIATTMAGLQELAAEVDTLKAAQTPSTQGVTRR